MKCDKRVPMVLFVDDERDICQSLARALCGFGYETLSTTDPFEAISLAERNDFDIAVIDLVMPQMEGLTLVKHLLRVDPRLKCVILTAYGAVESCNLAFQAGVVRYLQKPISVRALNEAFCELLERWQTTTAPPFEPSSSVDDDLSVTNTPFEGIVVPEPPDPSELTLDAYRRSAIRRYMLCASRSCRGCPKSIADKAGVSLPTVYRLLAEYDVPFDRKGRQQD